MPFCPECRLEYEPYVKVCPDCGAALVAKLPEIIHEDDVNVVLLLKTDDYMQAQLLCGALEEEGIASWSKRLGLHDRLGSGQMVAMTHVSFDPPKPAEVYVSPADLARAKEILAELTEGEVEPEEDDEEDS